MTSASRKAKTSLVCAQNTIAAAWTKHMYKKVAPMVDALDDPRSPAALMLRMNIRTWRRKKAIQKIVYFLDRLMRLAGAGMA